ncbi:MAG: hypothetical protein IPM93_18800 [Candidatus Obscuribacter sp.]|nr:hypothetical protein [Candidatus Obscuribacter sp.]
MSLGSGTAPKLSLSASDLDTIGLVYFKKGDYNRALSAWQSAPKLCPSLPPTPPFAKGPVPG